MSLATKCDRCGRMYMPYLIPIAHESQTGTYNGIRLCRISNDGRVTYEKPHMDLCPNCMDMLQRYLNKYLNNEEMETAKNEN